MGIQENLVDTNKHDCVAFEPSGYLHIYRFFGTVHTIVLAKMQGPWQEAATTKHLEMQ